LHKSIYVSIVIVSLVFGLLVSVQLRFSNATETGLLPGREHELSVEKRQLDRETVRLLEEVADLQAKIVEAGKGRTEAEVAMYSEFVKIRILAGFTDLFGPGIEVIIDGESEEEPQSGRRAVGDRDLLRIINDLCGAGAEAISVNGQRILATSEVRQAGRHININLVRMAPPYQITAIGNATTLKSSLEIKSGVVEDLEGSGISVSIEVKDGVLVPAFNGALNFDYAKPTQGGG
jgi:uncharacterized protein YlxW (UPF0749 family)